MREVNFDGLIGPSHNYAGLSLGNIASSSNAGDVSHPRKAALQGVAKMRRMIELGLLQGILLPHDRPNVAWLRKLGFSGNDEDVLARAWREEKHLFVNAFSASPMWTANAATVSPSPDTSDGRCHLSVANLSTMLHRSNEPAQTERQLLLAFSESAHFAVHGPLPGHIGDEGAANFMRVGPSHGAASLEIFVYGLQGDNAFPARQSDAAGRAIARRHGLADLRQLHVQQSSAAIAAGAFHNDVVAVANENVLFTHEQAFEKQNEVYAEIRECARDTIILEVPTTAVSLDEAIKSYLFNSKLVTLPDGAMILVVPGECRESPSVWQWLCDNTGGDHPVSDVEVVEVRESMRNGGGPACLRLRVAASEAAIAAIDSRFLIDERKCDLLAHIIETQWPERISPTDLSSPDLWAECRHARLSLLDALNFASDEL
nr:N-succinylarginine dihydrolase [Henriciella sp.]